MTRRSTYHYEVVDVFTDRPLEGNPLAVFLDGSELDGSTMQSIAQELNLSETVFVLPATQAGCAARLRIFTPRQELAFAGHPTVGTSFVLLKRGIVPSETERFVLEENIGPVPIRVAGQMKPLIWLTTPPIQIGQKFDRGKCANALGLGAEDLLDCEPQTVSAGNPFLFVALKNKEAVDRAWLDLSGATLFKGAEPHPNGVFVFAHRPEGAYSRMFAPEHGIAEDPATGSATGPLAVYMMGNHLVSGLSGTRFISEQGTKMGRRSILHVQINGEQGVEGIEVGGHVTPLVDAEMHLGR
ncbi:MAG: PhzF family phenazine biosynthesis protein [Acidobacteriaceae bacterium]|nr:PhzF family phenazine biosynthesis protein [Acidobacteriaceae bacterium]